MVNEKKMRKLLCLQAVKQLETFPFWISKSDIYFYSFKQGKNVLKGCLFIFLTHWRFNSMMPDVSDNSHIGWRIPARWICQYISGLYEFKFIFLLISVKFLFRQLLNVNQLLLIKSCFKYRGSCLSPNIVSFDS